jgi:DNA-binding CsgD family transcriptional regulator
MRQGAARIALMQTPSPCEPSPLHAAALSALLLALYRAARGTSIHDFQEEALSRLKALVPFDGGLWAAGTLVDGHARLQHAHVQSLSPRIVDLINSSLDSNAVMRCCLAALDVAHSFDHAAMQRDPIVARIAQQYHFQQMLCIVTVDPVTRLMGALSLVRHTAQPAFSAAERDWLTLCTPHLLETLNLARMTHLLEVGRLRGAQDRRFAITDGCGTLQVMEPGFAAMLRREYPDWVGPALPAALSMRDTNGETNGDTDGSADVAPRHLVGKSVCLDIENEGGMWLVALRPRNVFDRLTSQERAVATAYGEGHSHKEVARALGLAPATVRHHLRRVYGKLAVDDKAALARCLASSRD